MPEPCPFCGKPIVREYGSFRCKHCAGSSEDLIDIERKARVAEIRKHARGGDDDEPPLAAPIGPSTISSRLRAIAARSSAKPKPRPKAAKAAAPKAAASNVETAAPARAKSGARPKASATKSAKTPPAAAESDAKESAAKGPVAPSSKSARLRMVATAHARMAERKKGDAEPAVKPAKRSSKKD